MSNTSIKVYVTDEELGPNDVLFGRGPSIINYAGNVRFRQLVQTRKFEYNVSICHQIKGEVAKALFREIVEQRNGRFLQRIHSQSEADKCGVVPKGATAWKFASESAILEKIKQALRDKTPPKPKLVPTASQSFFSHHSAGLTSANQTLTEVHESSRQRLLLVQLKEIVRQQHQEQLRTQHESLLSSLLSIMGAGLSRNQGFTDLAAISQSSTSAAFAAASAQSSNMAALSTRSAVQSAHDMASMCQNEDSGNAVLAALREQLTLDQVASAARVCFPTLSPSANDLTLLMLITGSRTSQLADALRGELKRKVPSPAGNERKRAKALAK